MEVDRESQNELPFQPTNSYDEYEDMDNYIETQTKILQSETLALQTIKSLDLGTVSRIRRESQPREPLGKAARRRSVRRFWARFWEV